MLYSFAGALFPGGVRPASLGRKVDVSPQELPRMPGASIQPGRIQAREIKWSGTYINDDPSAFQADADAMLVSCQSAGLTPQPLFNGDPTRYLNAVCTDFEEDSPTGDQSAALYIAKYEITFLAADPFWYSAAAGPFAAVLSTSVPTIVTPGGNAPAAPVWSLIVGSAGTGTITLANALTLETATLTGTFAAGDTITLNPLGYVVVYNGEANFALLGGVIPSLPQGANPISLSSSGGLTINSAGVTYTPRYL